MVDVIAPRALTTQQTEYQRHIINFNDAGISNYRHLGTLPVGAFILSVQADVRAAFNGGTTNVLSVGTTFANHNELFAAGDITPGTVGYVKGTKGLGMSLTTAASPMELQPNGISVDTTEGGVGVYAAFTSTGTAPTAGQVVVVIEYVHAVGTV